MFPLIAGGAVERAVGPAKFGDTRFRGRTRSLKPNPGFVTQENRSFRPGNGTWFNGFRETDSLSGARTGAEERAGGPSTTAADHPVGVCA